MALSHWRAIYSVAAFVAVFGAAPAALGQATNKASEIVWMRGGHSDGISELDYSPDANLLATGSADWTLKLWRVADRQLVRTLIPHSAAVTSLAFSPNGRFLAVGTEANGHDEVALQVYETETFSKVLDQIIDNDFGKVVGLAFSPNGDLMAVAIDREDIRMYRTSDWDLQWLLQTSSDGATGIAFSPDGTGLAVAEAEDRNLLTLRDAATGVLLWSTSLAMEWIGAVAWSPTSDEILCAGNEFVEIRSAANGALRRTLNAPHVVAMDFAPDGASLAACSWPESPSIRVWDWPSEGLRYAIP